MSENITFSLHISMFFKVYRFRNKGLFEKFAEEYFFTRVLIFWFDAQKKNISHYYQCLQQLCCLIFL